MRSIKKIAISFIKWLNWFFTGISIRLVRWTGKAPQYIHPKHLLKETPLWMKYFSKEDVVLDIGCGNGQRDFRLSPNVKKITAFDYDKKSIGQAKEWQKANGIKNIEFLEISAENPLPFHDNMFDKILFLDVLEHLNNRNQIMKECHRILKTNGLLITSIPNSQTSWKKIQRSAGLNSYSDSDHKIEYTKDEAISAHTDAKFSVLETNPVVYDFPFTGIIDLMGGISLKLYKKLVDWKREMAIKHPENSIGFLIIAKK